jgi:hypothetical protein
VVTGFLGFAWLGPVVGPLTTHDSGDFTSTAPIIGIRRSSSASAKPRVNRQQAQKVWTSPWDTMDP